MDETSDSVSPSPSLTHLKGKALEREIEWRYQKMEEEEERRRAAGGGEISDVEVVGGSVAGGPRKSPRKKQGESSLSQAYLDWRPNVSDPCRLCSLDQVSLRISAWFDNIPYAGRS